MTVKFAKALLVPGLRASLRFELEPPLGLATLTNTESVKLSVIELLVVGLAIKIGFEAHCPIAQVVLLLEITEDEEVAELEIDEELMDEDELIDELEDTTELPHAAPLTQILGDNSGL